MPNRWILRIAVLLLVLGTAKYVDRDYFHQDESILQPAIEVTSVVIATCLALGAAFHYRTRLTFGWPYLLLLLTLTLALAFSARSWSPALSSVRGTLLMMGSLSVVALSRTFGMRQFLRRVLDAYLILILLGLALAFIAPDDFPLFLHDSGEEAVRLRLHLFRIHPISLADNCAICLVISALFHGRWMRICRIALATCLLMTVGRASIALGFSLYFMAELVYTRGLRTARKPASVIGFLAFVPALIAVGLLFANSDWSIVEQIRTSYIQIMDATKNNTTLSGRTLLWTMLIENLSPDNIYGFGVDGARYYIRTVNPWFGQSHNSLLETIYIGGYISAGLMVIALVGALIRLLANFSLPEARVLFFALCYVIGVGMMGPSWYETSSMIVISIACAGLEIAVRKPRLPQAAARVPVGAWQPS